MTGGEAFVLDGGDLLARVNSTLVDARRPDGPQAARLHELLRRHAELTGSVRARALLDAWDEQGASPFWRVAPRSELAKVEAVAEGSVGAPA
jgi:glutamate synthase domain-containing protein 3